MLPRLDGQSVVWCGPSSGSLGWLHDRIEQWCLNGLRLSEGQGGSEGASSDPDIRFVVSSDLEEVKQVALAGGQRVILACENRWDYSEPLLRQWSLEVPEVPIALALSDWWLGWRRTGIGHFGVMPTVCLPWFRWWDGWLPWLDGTCTSMFGPFPSSRPLSAGCSSRPAQQLSAIPSNSLQRVRHFKATDQRPQSAIVVGGCASTVQTWTLMLKAEGRAEPQCENTVVGNCILDDSLPKVLPGPERPEWVLWDDTRLATSRGPESNLAQAIDELKQVVQQYPESQLWVAWTQPVWAVIGKLLQANLSFELLAKPYLGSFSSAALTRT